jgi:hypothetical protein
VNRSPRSIALLTALRAQLARDASSPEASGMFDVNALLGRPANVYEDTAVPPTLRSPRAGDTAWLVGADAYRALTPMVVS